MALADPLQTHAFPGVHPIPHQPHNDAHQNAWVPPAPVNGQPEGHREDIPPPVGGITGPGRMQDPHHFDVAYQGVVDYHPQPIINPAYVFPDVGHAQGIPAQVQPYVPVNFERNPFSYGHQHNAPGPAFPLPFVYQNPTPNQAGAEIFRQLASRYVHHPDAQVRMICTEVAAPGRFNVVIKLESRVIF